MGLKDILSRAVGDGRTVEEKREDRYQRAEGMTTKGSSIARRAKERAAGKNRGDAKFVTGLGQRIGFAGIAMFTVGAALVGGLAASCDSTPTRPAPTTAATCEEDQPWCWDCSTMGNRRCGNDDGSVKR